MAEKPCTYIHKALYQFLVTSCFLVNSVMNSLYIACFYACTLTYHYPWLMTRGSSNLQVVTPAATL